VIKIRQKYEEKSDNDAWEDIYFFASLCVSAIEWKKSWSSISIYKSSSYRITGIYISRPNWLHLYHRTKHKRVREEKKNSDEQSESQFGQKGIYLKITIELYSREKAIACQSSRQLHVEHKVER
jgi:hypothetical protein